MEELIVEHFKNLFSVFFNHTEVEFLTGLKGRVNEIMNQELTIDYTAEEVYKVLLQMHPTKAPDLDGMAPVFFQNFGMLLANLLLLLSVNPSIR